MIAGHLDGSAGQPAAFWSLARLRPGDGIVVTTADGRALQFRVTMVARYDRTSVPLVRVFGPAPAAHLNLITCAGRYLGSQRGYQERLVVYSTLVSAGPG